MGSIKKICMYQGILSQISAFFIDIVGGGKKSEYKDETSVAKRGDPNSAHPGGYSQRDTVS